MKSFFKFLGRFCFVLIFSFTTLITNASSVSVVPSTITPLLLLDESSDADEEGIVLASGIQQGDSFVFTDVDGQGLDVTIRSNAQAVSLVAQGVLIEGFIPSSATVSIEFSRPVSLDEMNLFAGENSPTFVLRDFSVNIESASSDFFETIVSANNSFPFVNVGAGFQPEEPFTLNLDAVVTSVVTFIYSGSPGSGFRIAGFNLD